MMEEAEANPQASGGVDAGGAPEELDIRALDAQYNPISPFSEWAGLGVDHAIWTRQLEFLEERGAQLVPEDLHRALTVAMRAAAVDSGAIEGLYETDRGLTYTIAAQEAMWQTTMRQRDDRLHDFLEAQVAAYDLASEIAESRQPVTEVWIRQLHQVLCKPQASYKALTPQGWAELPLPKGEYKRQPNHVRQADGSLRAYAPVDLTPAEMHGLVDEVKSAQFAGAHPVVQAAYAHYCLAAIHPFADGNGRVARAVASVFLRRAGRIPLLIWADQRTEYFDALEAADKGNRQAFVDFVFDRAIDAFTLVTNELGPHPEEPLAVLSKLHVSYGGLTFQELDNRAAQITNRVAEIAGQVIAELTSPAGVHLSVGIGGPAQSISDPAYRTVQGSAVTTVTMQSSAPAQARRELRYQVFVAWQENARYAFRLECTTQAGAALEIRLRDVHPTMSDALAMQIRAWVRRTLAEGLAQLAADAEGTLRQAGF